MLSTLAFQSRLTGSGSYGLHYGLGFRVWGFEVSTFTLGRGTYNGGPVEMEILRKGFVEQWIGHIFLALFWHRV